MTRPTAGMPGWVSEGGGESVSRTPRWSVRQGRENEQVDSGAVQANEVGDVVEHIDVAFRRVLPATGAAW